MTSLDKKKKDKKTSLVSGLKNKKCVKGGVTLSLSPSPPPSLLLQFLGCLSINNVPKMQQILFLLLPRMPGIWGETREMGTRKPLKLIIMEAPGSRDGSLFLHQLQRFRN